MRFLIDLRGEEFLSLSLVEHSDFDGNGPCALCVAINSPLFR